MLLLALATVTTQHLIVPTNHRCTASTCAFASEMFKHVAVLNSGTSAVYLYWSLSQDNDEIAIGIDAHDTNGWVAVGISANGGMMGADIWRLSEDDSGNLVLDDMFVEDWVTPRRDAEQNLKLQGAQQANGRTSFWFTRKVRTCDGGGMRWATNWTSEDFDILGVGDDSNTGVNLIWATGPTHAFYYHGDSATRRGKYGQHTWHPAGTNSTPVAPTCEDGLTTHRLNSTRRASAPCWSSRTGCRRRARGCLSTSGPCATRRGRHGTTTRSSIAALMSRRRVLRRARACKGTAARRFSFCQEME